MKNKYKLPTELAHLTCCVYGLWLPDRSRVYVGSTTDFGNRYGAHRPALQLGCILEIAIDLPHGTRRKIREWEDRAILALRKRCVDVVNATNQEIGRRNLIENTTLLQRQEAGRQGRALQDSTASSLGGKKAWKRKTKAQRKAHMNKMRAGIKRPRGIKPGKLTTEHLAALVAGRKKQAAALRTSSSSSTTAS